ncbi:mitochondrial carrier domain-containing protein [Lipomyces kononenkoae]|uniref:Mitochondrial carrier domain-containing protein n=1 Tax=Lipomyces kononenkoae TaxID=34357 RepID=A0ACC3STC1_LIPKO
MKSEHISAPLNTTLNSSRYQHILSGFVSGFASAVLLQPFDLLKTRIQQSPTSTLRSSWQELLLADISRTQYTRDSALNVLRKLWRGTLPSVIRTSVGSGLYFSTLHSLRSYVQKHSAPSISSGKSSVKRSSVLPQVQGYANLLTGSFARGAVGFVMMPVTVLKVRFESSTYSHSSLLQTARAIHSAHGVRGFFFGFGATFVRDAPYAGIYVFVYEYAKDRVPDLLLRTPFAGQLTTEDSTPRMLSSPISVLVNLICAGFSATTAVTMTNPFDAVKTRMQLFPDRYGTKMWAAFAAMLREESGIRGLFDGLGLRIVRKGLSSGIAWCLYEELIRRY